MEYLFTEVFSSQPLEFSRYFLGTAVLDRFCGPLCEAVCMPGAEPFTCEFSGWEFIRWLKKENIFLIPLDPEKRWFRYHHLFRKLLLNQLNRQFTAEEVNSLHSQASVWFADNGLIEEALQHALTAGDIPAAMQLVSQYGHQLMNDQQWQRLAQWLKLLPSDQVAQTFGADLALRQGRIAEANKLLKGPDDFQLRPGYRFYMPQLTQIHILLAQGTRESRRQTADLIDLTLTFFKSIHNKRFQIDLLHCRLLLMIHKTIRRQH